MIPIGFKITVEYRSKKSMRKGSLLLKGGVCAENLHDKDKIKNEFTRSTCLVALPPD